MSVLLAREDNHYSSVTRALLKTHSSPHVLSIHPGLQKLPTVSEKLARPSQDLPMASQSPQGLIQLHRKNNIFFSSSLGEVFVRFLRSFSLNNLASLRAAM